MIKSTARLATLMLATLTGVPQQTVAQEQTVDYQRAERFLTWHTNPLITGNQVNPQWMEGGNRFWFRNKTTAGHEFIIVDPERNIQGLLFDHARMASALTLAADTAYVGEKLPFNSFEFTDEAETEIEFTLRRREVRCHIQSYTCAVGDSVPQGENRFVESPDSEWEVFAKDYNLFLRPAGGGDTIQLTDDGEEFHSYGLGNPRPTQLLNGNDENRRPQVIWSPDSKKILVSRQDSRDVEHMHYISYTSQRPRHFSQPYALPGDSVVPTPGIHIIDIETKGNVTVEMEPTPARLYFSNSQDTSPVDSTWSSNSQDALITWSTRASKSLYLGTIDAATGNTTVLAKDTSKTHVGGAFLRPYNGYFTEAEEDAFIVSERDGWAHIWRFDSSGDVKSQVTSGAWAVESMLYVDEATETIYFNAFGREADSSYPYYDRVYKVNFDGSGLTLLTPEDANHQVEFSPTGAYFVDTYSRVETPQVTVLRSAMDGRVIRTVEEADISQLAEIGWQPARTFTVKARDGVTDIHGIMYLPPNLDPEKKYPVINHIYPGPQRGSVGSWTFKGGGENFSLAQLGFIVIQIDHLGTPERSKAFHDAYYGNFGDNGLPDHVTAIRQLGARYPFIDLDRVGIYGHSGGGFASTDAMLRYPDFFKVAVSGAGNHDNRSYNIYWAETYQGLLEEEENGSDNFEDSANKTHVENLEGKLLLMHGDMDDNVHPANTIQLINELIKANKDFDLIMAPDRGHGLNEPYFIRRRWDYFVRHLMGMEPPKEYEITRPSN